MPFAAERCVGLALTARAAVQIHACLSRRVAVAVIHYIGDLSIIIITGVPQQTSRAPSAQEAAGCGIARENSRDAESRRLPPPFTQMDLIICKHKLHRSLAREINAGNKREAICGER